MEQMDGEEDSALTWGDLTETPCSLGNFLRKEKLNSQESADAIVPRSLERMREGLNI